MIYKAIIILYVFFFSFPLSAQQLERGERKRVLAALIQSNRQIADTLLLSELSARYQQHYGKEKWTDDIGIMTTVLWATNYANIVDSLNSRSDSLFNAALTQAKQFNKMDVLAWATVEYAYYHYQFRDLNNAMTHFVQGMSLLGKVPHEQIVDPANTYRKVAYYLITIAQPNEALNYLKIAQKFARNPSVELGDILCAIGSVYLSLHDYPLAESYFQRSLSVAKKSGDRLRQAKVWGYLARIQTVHHNYDRAEESINRDIALSIQVGDVPNLIYSHKHYAELLLKQDKVREAEVQLEKSLEYAFSKPYYRKRVRDIVKLQLLAAKKRNDPVAELLARRNLDNLEEEVSKLDGDKVIQSISLRTEKEIMRLSLEAENEKYVKKVIWRNAIVIFFLLFILLTTLFVIAYRHQMLLRKDAYKDEILVQQLRKTELAFKQESGKRWVSKEELLERESENSKFDWQIEKRTQELHTLVQSHLVKEEDWQRFKKVFEEEKFEFAREIKETLPGLTDSNLRILYLQHMGLNNPNIAHVLGVTLEAVKKNKQRMRRKYGYASIPYLGATA